jgi:hypothetical protein
MTDNEQFNTLIRTELATEELETFVIPKWFVTLLCYALPASWLLPIAFSSGQNIILPVIFIAILGTSAYFFLNHLASINMFIRQEKPLREVLAEARQHETAQREKARSSSPDALLGSTRQLSSTEENDWQNIISGISLTASDPVAPKRKNRFRKKKD